MKNFPVFLAIALFAAAPAHSAGALAVSSPLYQKILSLDSELFSRGFNECRLDVMLELAAHDLEFFHDEGGIVRGRQAFVESVRKGVCENDYRATRELQQESLEIFPLKQNGKIYGAIQRGRHVFLAQHGNGPARKTSSAEFSHVWLLDGDIWKLARVLSYGHLPAEDES